VVAPAHWPLPLHTDALLETPFWQLASWQVLPLGYSQLALDPVQVAPQVPDPLHAVRPFIGAPVTKVHCPGLPV
jgi:hypothetical protein